MRGSRIKCGMTYKETGSLGPRLRGGDVQGSPLATLERGFGGEVAENELVKSDASPYFLLYFASDGVYWL